MSVHLIAMSEFFDLMSSILPVFFIVALAVIFIYEYESLKKEKG
jgi:hypothetical protein